MSIGRNIYINNEEVQYIALGGVSPTIVPRYTISSHSLVLR